MTTNPRDRDERAFPFLWINERDGKPRTQGLTEIRGSYHNLLTKTQLRDLLEVGAQYVDSYKYSGGTLRLMPRSVIRETNDICHSHNVAVSTGGNFEFPITRGPQAVDQFLGECRDLGVDIIEISTGFITLSTEDQIRLTKKVISMGLKAKPEVNIGGTGFTNPAEMEAAGVLEREPSRAIDLAKRQLDAGAAIIMMESEGITEGVPSRIHWRTDVIGRFANEIGLNKMMFEASDPAVFAWYIKNFGPNVNLFVDHTQLLTVESFRTGVSGDREMWGRVFTYNN